MRDDYLLADLDTIPEPLQLSSEALNEYRKLMIDIKTRSEFIEQLDTSLPRHIGWLESVCLQIRKILENIAYACLVANGQHMPNKIRRKYNPDEILSKLDQVIPGCWPEPVLTNKPEPTARRHPQDAGTIDTRPSGDWLIRAELPEIYGRLGDLLHNRNPLRSSYNDINYFITRLPKWHHRIRQLLTKHKIAIISEEEMYLVQISPNGVTITPFVRIGPT